MDGGRDAIGISPDGKTVYSKVMFGSAYAFASDVPAPAPGKELGSSEKIWAVRDSLGYDIGTSALTVAGGLLLIPSDKGNIVALDAADGSFKWAHKVSLALVNPLKIIEKRGRISILASTMDGTVELLTLDN